MTDVRLFFLFLFPVDEYAREEREEWHKKSLQDLEARLVGLRQEREGKVDALKAENDELRKRFGLK